MIATKLFEYSNAVISHRFTNIDVSRSTTYHKVPFAIDANGVETGGSHCRVASVGLMGSQCWVASVGVAIVAPPPR